MGYARDNDAAEQCAQGDEFGRKPTDFEVMLERNGYTDGDWLELSNTQRERLLWNWKHIQKERAK